MLGRDMAADGCSARQTMRMAGTCGHSGWQGHAVIQAGRDMRSLEMAATWLEGGPTLRLNCAAGERVNRHG